VQGSGNSITTQNYSFIDENPLNGINYYRLKQIDYDGKFTYSNIVALKSQFLNPESQILIYPNPVNDKLNCEFGLEKETIAIEINDILGNVVLKKEIKVTKGSTRHTINTSPWSQGMYFIKAGNRQVKFVKE